MREKEKKGIHGEQIPLKNCDGAEGGTRTPTGFPIPPQLVRLYNPLESLLLSNSYHYSKIAHSVDFGTFPEASEEIGHKNR